MRAKCMIDFAMSQRCEGSCQGSRNASSFNTVIFDYKSSWSCRAVLSTLSREFPISYGCELQHGFSKFCPLL